MVVQKSLGSCPNSKLHSCRRDVLLFRNDVNAADASEVARSCMAISTQIGYNDQNYSQSGHSSRWTFVELKTVRYSLPGEAAGVLVSSQAKSFSRNLFDCLLHLLIKMLSTDSPTN